MSYNSKFFALVGHFKEIRSGPQPSVVMGRAAGKGTNQRGFTVWDQEDCNSWGGSGRLWHLGELLGRELFGEEGWELWQLELSWCWDLWSGGTGNSIASGSWSGKGLILSGGSGSTQQLGRVKQIPNTHGIEQQGLVPHTASHIPFLCIAALYLSVNFS